MDITRIEAAVDPHAAEIDSLARSLNGKVSRRRTFGLLAGALAAGLFGISRRGEAEAAATSIPPNCIYVCCDGTCDSWKMCLRCVTWPKPTTATTIAAK
jgi:hypothetical protein